MTARARSSLRTPILSAVLLMLSGIACTRLQASGRQDGTGPLPRMATRAELPGLNPRDIAGILAVHNAERSRLHEPDLIWDDALAQEADGWAHRIADLGILEHTPEDLIHGEGENLFMGTAGAYSLEDMITAFVEERADFAAGVFPDIARDGNWENVGHYTQIIWPQTRRVGCSLARGRDMDFLVCRYFPAGNVIGRMVP